MAKRDVTSLHTALESYGRRARGLSAARLEHYPDVLIELYGEEAVSSASDRQTAAVRVEAALRGIIVGIKNPTDRRIAEAVFAASPEFWDMNVTERQEYVEREEQPLFTRELYKTQRARIVGDVAAALRGALDRSAETDREAVLSPQGRRAAKQLYRYLQDAIIGLLAYDFCADMLDVVDSANKYVHVARFVAKERERTADSALWSYTYSHRYFNDCLRDQSARDFLRENLSDDWWSGTRFQVPFTNADLPVLLEALAAASEDNAGSFGNQLCQSEDGRGLSRRWMTLLGSGDREWRPRHNPFEEPSGYDRVRLCREMRQLCVVLQTRFPDDTRMGLHAEAEFGSSLDWITYAALREAGIPRDDNGDGSAVHEAARRAIDGRPFRFMDQEGVLVDWGLV